MRSLLLAAAGLAVLVAGLTSCNVDPANDRSSNPPWARQAKRLLPRKGDRMPDIVGYTLDGQAMDNSRFAGKTTLINVWFYG